MKGHQQDSDKMSIQQQITSNGRMRAFDLSQSVPRLLVATGMV